MKKFDKNLNEAFDKRTFKKSYILRKHEENEAKEEIQQYEDSQTGNGVTRLDGLGSLDDLSRMPIK